MTRLNQRLSILFVSLMAANAIATENAERSADSNQANLDEVQRLLIDEFDDNNDGELSRGETNRLRSAVRDFLQQDGRVRRSREREDRLLATLELLLQRVDANRYSRPNLYSGTPATSSTFPNTPPEARHHHSSTAAEGWLRGRAVLLQAFANYVLQRSQAAVLWEHAESLHYDNYLKRGETAFARKRMVDEYRDYKRQRSLTRRRAGEEFREQDEQRIVREYALSAYEFNPANGAVYWPALVAGPRFSQERQRIENLVRQVVRNVYRDGTFAEDQLAKACEELREKVRQEYLEHEAKEDASVEREYRHVLGFLIGLKYVPHYLDDLSPQSLLASN